MTTYDYLYTMPHSDAEAEIRRLIGNSEADKLFLSGKFSVVNAIGILTKRNQEARPKQRSLFEVDRKSASCGPDK